LRTLEDADCEALQRGVSTRGKGRDTSLVVTPINTRGEVDRWNATRVCDAMSRRRDARTAQRSNVMECARRAGARLECGSETEVEGARGDGLNVDIRTGESGLMGGGADTMGIRTWHE